MVFLMETRLKKEEGMLINYKCGFECCQMVKCTGEGRKRSRGLMLIWRENVRIGILSFSSNHTGGSIEDEIDSQRWFFNGVYDFLEEINKRKT